MKPIKMGKYTIILREGKWVVLIGKIVQHTFDNEGEAKRWASSNL